MSELVTFHGASGELAKKLVAAHKAGLVVREITHGRNGYPEPFHGEFFVSGFENFAAAEAFAKANGGVVGEAHSRDGWHAVDDFSETSGPLTYTDDLAGLIGDDERIETAADEKAYLAERLKDAEEREDEAEVQKCRELMAEFAAVPDTAIVLMDSGELDDWWSEDETMAISHDTHHHEIGVRLVADDEEGD